MSEPRELVFQGDGEFHNFLPPRCSIGVSCYAQPEIQQLVAATLQSVLESLARTGMDLRALDGTTLTPDCAATALAIQPLPEGQLPLQTGDQPDMMEIARTVPVWRDGELLFHMVVRAGLGVGLLSEDRPIQAVALACVAHEASHVQHEGHLYRMFPHIYGRQIPCGERSSKLFIKAMDVWSEYAACRSSAMFRPEAGDKFEKVFCRAMETCFTACTQRTVACQDSADAQSIVSDTEQLVGDAYVCAGYFLGHLDGLGLDFSENAPGAHELSNQHPQVGDLLLRLHWTLRELWKSEPAWPSIEVFAPVYDVLSAMMAYQGQVFDKDSLAWRIGVEEEIRLAGLVQASLDQ